MSDWKTRVTDEDVLCVLFDNKLELIIRIEDGCLHVEQYMYGQAHPNATLSVQVQS